VVGFRHAGRVESVIAVSPEGRAFRLLEKAVLPAYKDKKQLPTEMLLYLPRDSYALGSTRILFNNESSAPDAVVGEVWLIEDEPLPVAGRKPSSESALPSDVKTAPNDPGKAEKKATSQTDAGGRRQVAVVCRLAPLLQYGNANVDRDLARQMTLLLQQHLPKIATTDQRKINRWTDENVWEEYTELGDAMKADVVVGIDVDSFTVYAGQTLYQGKADVTVKVYDCRNGKLLLEKELPQIVYPPDVPIQSTECSEAEFRRHFLGVLAQRIGELFYGPHVEVDLAKVPTTASHAANATGRCCQHALRSDEPSIRHRRQSRQCGGYGRNVGRHERLRLGRLRLSHGQRCIDELRQDHRCLIGRDQGGSRTGELNPAGHCLCRQSVRLAMAEKVAASMAEKFRREGNDNAGVGRIPINQLKKTEFVGCGRLRGAGARKEFVRLSMWPILGVFGVRRFIAAFLSRRRVLSLAPDGKRR